MASRSRGKVTTTTPRAGATIWLTRAQTADRLGLTISGVRGRVGLGLLKEYRDDRGTARYDAAEVDQMAKDRPAGKVHSHQPAGTGDLTATAFQMFERVGVDVRRAVVELRIPTEVAERLAEEYGRTGGEIVLKAGTVRDVRRLLGDRHPELPMNDALLPQLVTDYAQRIAREREDAGRRYDERLKAERELVAKQVSELQENLKTVTDERDAVITMLAAVTAKINAAADSTSGAVPAAERPTSPTPPVVPTPPGEVPVSAYAAPTGAVTAPQEMPQQPSSVSQTAAGAPPSGDLPMQAVPAPVAAKASESGTGQL